MSLNKKSIRVAAIQMCADLGEVDANLKAAERLVGDAFTQGAEWVILPEFFTSAVGFHPKMLDAARPSDGEPFKLLKDLARGHGGVVGGSFIALRGNDAYNTFFLVFPDGSCFTHDKDIPTMWENCYYIGGTDDGVLDTPWGKVGVALCWEQVRTQTVKRMIDRIDLVVGGSCWWDLPDNYEGEEADKQRARNLDLLKRTPSTIARMLGVPMVHASHAGEFDGLNPFDEKMPYRSRFLGETQIVDGRGNTLARRSYQDGEGVVLADIETGRVPETREPVPDGFWIPDHPESVIQAWERQNEFGRDYYTKVTRPHRRGNQLSPGEV